MMQLSVVIVNYNVRYFLEQALLSVRKAAAGIEAEVWVVDNNSVDDSVRMVREKFPEVRLIENKTNPGFSAANNQAIRQARGRYILLLNPDTVVEETTFARCLAFMDQHPEAGALGVRMIDGSGQFLPESKRGFPTPFVAFCKVFGLSALFPGSRLFNRYHLGFLDEHNTHAVDVLSGAFMLLRREALDKTGLLDEAFFMYGEDIDLSYRITQAGYKNYYFADTTIIHYKGESTKKGSLNYVRTFYNAMIIFARKHFGDRQARWYVWVIRLAIYFRALLSVVLAWTRRLLLPLADALLIFVGMYFLKNYWAANYFKNPDYYQPSFLYFNVPLYIAIWLLSVYLNGGYDDRYDQRRLIRGLAAGTLFLAAVYGFLDPEYRPSRMLIVLGAIWAFAATYGLRLLLHFRESGSFQMGSDRLRNLVIVGSRQESDRVRGLLQQANVRHHLIGTVAPGEADDHDTYLSNFGQLDEVVQIYKVDEIIFCARDVSAQDIMQCMSRLGSSLEYRIVPEESFSIVGSSSKDTAGELYTIDIKFNIDTPMNRRNKRLFDLGACCVLLALSPVLVWLVKHPLHFFTNLLGVLAGRYTWVGYAPVAGRQQGLPHLRPGILSPPDALPFKHVNQPTRQRLNMLYAKNYEVGDDFDILWKSLRQTGRKPA